MTATVEPPTLFDDALVRETDPATSHEVAKADRSTLLVDCLSAVRAAGWAGATTDDVFDVLVRQGFTGKWNSVSRRLTTLCRDGLISAVGERPTNGGKSKQRVYRSRAYLSEMGEQA